MGNPHDSQTIASTLEQHELLTGKRAKIAIVDRGYAKREIGGTQVLKPDNGKAKTDYEKGKNRKRFRSRAGIEAIISHLKQQFRMGKKYLKGIISDPINAMLVAAAWNFRKWMREMAHSFLFFFQNSINNLFSTSFLNFFIYPKKKNGVVKD